MADYPALPLWTDAYLADCGHLSDAEHGRYLQVLMAMWRAHDCRLPNDNEWLARKFRRTVDDVVSQLRPIIAEFCQTDGNWIFQKRLLREREHVAKTSKKQSGRAKSRWNKEKDECRGNAKSGNAPTPTTTPIPPISTDANASRSSEADFFERWYAAYPHKVGKGQAKKAFPSALRRANGLEALIAGVDRYIKNKPPDRPWCNPATWLNGDRWLDEPELELANGQTDETDTRKSETGSDELLRRARERQAESRKCLAGRAG